MATAADPDPKEIKELLLIQLQPLRARISQLLEPAGPTGPRRVVTGDHGWRCLAFLETELSIMAASLTSLVTMDGETLSWRLCSWCSRVPDFADDVLHQVDTSGHTLLRRATRCFHRSKSHFWLLENTVGTYRINEGVSRYTIGHLLVTSSSIGLTPQRDEAGALPLVGIDRPAKKIFRWITRQGKMDMNLRVMCIVGPVGIGKTTLAVELHETSRGRYNFQCNVMAQVQRGTDRNIRLLQDILSQVSEPAATTSSSDPSSEGKTMEVLVRLVSECLRDKRYFIIIDDIRKASDWEEIKDSFPNNIHGSGILITTRSTSTAWACCSDSYYGLVHEMKPLSEVEQVPRLPEQALSSAFYDLPDDESRLLLLCMSMFPYGYKFEKDRLMLKWLLEGPTFIFQFSITISRAEPFFSQLVDRNVISCVASNCKHKHDEAEACQWQVNHLIQQFLASKSAEMGFAFTTATLNLVAAAAATSDRGNQTSSRMPRRLALHHPDPLLLSQLEHMDLSQTRSLAVSGAVDGIPLDKFVNLVILDLEGWENLKDEDLQHIISKMFFLTYLSVRNTRVSKLPHEVRELRILRALDASYTRISELPIELFELPGLWYLDLRGTQISQLPEQIAGLRYSLQCLLVDTAVRLPLGVRNLQNLETLATVDLTEQPASFLRALGDLHGLMALAVTWSFHQSTDRDYCEALLLSIAKRKRSMKSLTIHCGLGCSMEFLGSLEESGAPWRLEKFKVTAGRFASVPPWIHGLEHLAFVQITVCNKQTTTDDLKILGALPHLQCLILGLDFIPGHAIEIENEGFRELKKFTVDCPMAWLSFSTVAMRKLTYLQLKFSSTPASQICVPSGISNLHGLTEVALCYNAHYINSPSVKMTVEAVTQQVAEHSNPIDLFINGIEQDDVQEADDEMTENTIGTSSRTNVGAEDDAQAVGEEATGGVQCEITEAES